MRALLVMTGLLLCLWVGPAQPGWNSGDLVVDYGVSLSDGERLVIVDADTVGNKFPADLLWQIDPLTCRVQVLAAAGGDRAAAWADLPDDGAFHGHPAHATVSLAEALGLVANKGRHCEIGTKPGEFLTVSTAPGPTVQQDSGAGQLRLGATVLVLRATSFYMPGEVRVKVGETVVWFYADGSREPHTVTSGACKGADCSGGGQVFASGPTLLKPGDRFQHAFTQPGTYPYHCDFHTTTMQGTVIVRP